MQIMAIMTNSSGPLKSSRAGEQKHVFNEQWPNIRFDSLYKT